MSRLIIIIFSAGIFGGTVNFFQLFSIEYRGWINYWKCVIIGLGASFLVPLFLEMISSNLVENTKTNEKDCLVFLGFCLTASIFSRKFIESIGEKILKQVEKANENAKEAKELAVINKEEVNLIASKTTEIDPSDTISASTIDTKNSKQGIHEEEAKLVFTEFANILRVLKDATYTFRTLNGIVKDSKLNREKVEFAILLMKEHNWIKEIKKEGKLLYALTDEGNKLQLTE